MIRAELWTPADGYVLEPNALRAAREPRANVVLTAGPGAGKTELLAQRADFLLRTGGCRYPRRILAISFKLDASRNLKSRVLDRCGPVLAVRFDSHTFHAFAKRLIDRFRPVLTGDDALDADYTIGPARIRLRQIQFEDMVPLAVQILEASPLARNAVRNTYSHVFLDEFQDCTNLQYRLVRTAFGPTDAVLTAVGDTKQRIMGWAGALEGIFETFAEDFAATSLNLYQNFRAAARLRRMQNAMVHVMDPAAALPDNQIIGSDGDVEVAHYETSTDEANDLADRIDDWIHAAGIAPSEIAVLVSRDLDFCAAVLMAELEARGIPFRNEQHLQDLFAEPAAQLIVDFLSVLMNDRQPDTYRRLMRVLVDGSIDEDAEYRERARWQRYIDEQRSMIRSAGLANWSSAEILSIIDDFISRVSRERLAALAPDYAKGSRLDEIITSTCERLQELTDIAGSAAGALERFTDDGAVRILTIHKSKGLEFHTVVILGVETETFWGQIADERAAFFVGISRAKRRLVLTVSDTRPKPAGFPRRWTVMRTPHAEFISYVQAATP